MLNALWLASIFGPYMAILGLWMLLYTDTYVKMLMAIKNSTTAFYFSGTINLLVGIAVLSWYSIWDWEPYVLITLLGWGMIVRGVFTLFMPQVVTQLIENNQPFFRIMGSIPLIWGLALCWVAFFM